MDLCGCKYLSDDALIALTKNFPNLTYLNLVKICLLILKTWCVLLSDKCVINGIAKYLKKLNLLSLYGLASITDASIIALEQSKLKFTLETFDINGCKEISVREEQTLKTMFPNLKVLIFHS